MTTMSLRKSTKNQRQILDPQIGDSLIAFHKSTVHRGQFSARGRYHVGIDLRDVAATEVIVEHTLDAFRVRW